MTEKQRQAIERHGENLNKIFNTGLDPVKLCKKLISIERKAHNQAEDYCNGAMTMDQWEDFEISLLERLDKILNFTERKILVFINGDPRGYALKIHDKYIRDNDITIHRDWGGYGIIAPEIGKDGY